jgi:hypothetical protein
MGIRESVVDYWKIAGQGLVISGASPALPKYEKRTFHLVHGAATADKSSSALTNTQFAPSNLDKDSSSDLFIIAKTSMNTWSL